MILYEVGLSVVKMILNLLSMTIVLSQYGVTSLQYPNLPSDISRYQAGPCLYNVDLKSTDRNFDGIGAISGGGVRNAI